MNAHDDHPELHYLTGRAAVGLNPGLSCGHGDTAVDIVFRGTPCKPGALPDTVNTLMPRCAFADLVGTVIAFIRFEETPEAAQRFRDQVLLAESTALHELQQT
ncbi:hypothetical protein JHN59_38140 [Streptomyces sp. MBT49]|uniref:hypothetical protein n=1 Tax=Streptomyces sp. MBT49 TaxID=1488380 RepID=UPI00190BA2D1|nr:hypothetical protein [Streptomyces sp. MBT49]MBK3630520.1 hypothetical protein [Streptomyces sp. MBT49]